MKIFANLPLSFALPRVQGEYGSHMRDGGHMFSNNLDWGSSILQIVVLTLALAAVVAFTLFVARMSAKSGRSERGSSALERLDESYAKGSVNREEYLQRKKDIMER